MYKLIFEKLNNDSFKSLVLALCSVLALPYVLQIPSPLIITNSILSLLFFWCFYVVIKKTIEKSDKRQIFYSWVFGWIFSFLLTVGRNLSLYANIDCSFGGIIKILVIATAFSFIFGVVIYNIFHKILTDKIFENLDLYNISEFFVYDKYYYFKIMVLLIVAWLPIFFIFFPGIFEYDVPTQLKEAVSGEYTNWHPVLHTLYLYGSMILGRTLFHCDEAGVLIYVIPQMLFMASVFAYCCSYFSKIKLPTTVQLTTLLFFAFYPLISIQVISTTKDVIFGGLIMLFTLFCLQAVYDSKQFFFSKKTLFCVFSVVSLALLFRTNAVVIFLVLLPFLLFAFRKYAVKILLVIFVPIVLYFGLIFYVYPSLNIGQTRPEEPISVPLHQMARVLKYKDSQISAKDKETFYEIIQPKSLTRYQHSCMDYLKMNLYTNWEIRTFNGEAFLKNPKKYYELWSKLGKKYPAEYAKAFFALNVPFWYPDYIYKIKNHSLNYFIAVYNINETTSTFFVNQSLTKRRVFDLLFFRYIDEKYQDQPLYLKNFVTANLFSTGLPCWFLLFGIFFVIYCRNYKYLMPLLVPFSVLVTYLFAPTYLLRYNFSLIISLPIIIAIIALCALEQRKKEI